MEEWFSCGVVEKKSEKKSEKERENGDIEAPEKKEGEEETENAEHWWAGSFKDIIFNTSGLAAGIAIHFAFSGFKQIANF